MNIKNRLLKLESSNVPKNTEGTNIILVRLVATNQPKEEIDHIWSSFGDDYHKTADESVMEFEERACTHIRKLRQVDPKNCLLLFGESLSALS